MIRCFGCMNEIQETANVCPHCGQPVPAPAEKMTDLRPGSWLYGNRFLIGKARGHGGYGITYAAFDATMNSKRAIKEFFPRNIGVRSSRQELIYDPSRSAEMKETRERFLHEARLMTLAGNAHIPHMVQVFDKFDENDTSYLVMELLEGETLDSIMSRRQAPFAWKDAVHYVIQALEGLEGLHKLGIIHRDISCNNIFMVKKDNIYLIDLGSAEMIEDARNHPGRIQRSVKPPYTAREQINQQPQGTYTDVYAMAVVLFKLIVGRVDQKLNGGMLPPIRTIMPNAKLPASLERTLQDATNPDPAKRIQTAAEFRNRLEPLVRKRHVVRNLLIASVVTAFGIYLGVRLSRNNTQNEVAFSVPVINFADDAGVRGSVKTVKKGESVQLQGEGEPGQSIWVSVSYSNTEVTRYFTTVNSDGLWEQTVAYDVIPGGDNEILSYQINAGYEKEDEPQEASRQQTIQVDNRFERLQFSFEGASTGRTASKAYGDLAIVSGKGQPEEPVTITVSNDQGTVKTQQFIIPSSGVFRETILTEDLPVDTDAEATFSLEAKYTKAPQAETDGQLHLTVSNRFAPLTLVWRSGSSTTAYRENDTVRVGGSHEPGETVIVNVQEGGRIIWTRDVATTSSAWELDIAIAELQPGESDHQYTVSAIYASSETAAENTLQLRVAGILRKPTIQFQDSQTDSLHIENNSEMIRLQGTAAPDRILHVYATPVGEGERRMPGTQSALHAESNAEWVFEFNVGSLGVSAGESTEFLLRVVYVDDESVESDAIFLSITLDEERVELQQPDIRFLRENGNRAMAITLTERTETFSMTGTAAPGQTLILYADGKEMETIQVGEDRKWTSSTMTADTFGIQPGQETTVQLLVAYASDAENQSDSRELYINLPEELDPPTAAFAETDDRSVAVRISETIQLEGTANPGKNLIISINDDQSGGLIRTMAVQSGQEGIWLYELDLRDLNVTLGDSRTMRITVSYTERDDVAASEPLTVTLENPRFVTPVISLVSATGQYVEKDGVYTLGDAGATMEIKVAGEPGQSVILNCWTSESNDLPAQTLSNEGETVFNISLASLPGSDKVDAIRLSVRYEQQTVTVSETMSIGIDQTADRIDVPQSILETAAEIRGTAEPGAIIQAVDATEKTKECQVNPDGSFTLNELDLEGLTEITLLETDQLGNTASVVISITESPRSIIQVNAIFEDGSISPCIDGGTYYDGRNRNLVGFVGTASGKKTLKITMEGVGFDGSASAMEGEAETDASGEWESSRITPEVSGIATITVAYQDEKGTPVQFTFQGDWDTDAPQLSEQDIYTDTEAVTVTAEQGATVWATSGEWKGEKAVATNGRANLELSLPDTATELTIHAEDEYGNINETTVKVFKRKMDIVGKFESPKTDGEYTANDPLKVKVYALIGDDVPAQKRSFKLVLQKHGDSAPLNVTRDFEEIGDDEFAVKIRSYTELDLSRGYKKMINDYGGILSEYETGTYELILYYEGERETVELDRIRIQWKDSAAGMVKADYNTVEQWAAGIDDVDYTCAPEFLWLTGYYYHGEGTFDVSSVTVHVYEDQGCTSEMFRDSCAVGASGSQRNRLPRSVDAISTQVEAVNQFTAGMIIWIQGRNRLTDGQTVYVKLEFADVNCAVLGPFAIPIDSSSEYKNIRDVINNRTENWE